MDWESVHLAVSWWFGTKRYMSANLRTKEELNTDRDMKIGIGDRGACGKNHTSAHEQGDDLSDNPTIRDPKEKALRNPNCTQIGENKEWMIGILELY